MVVVTYYSDIGSIGGADRYEHLLRLMPPRRREKMDRFVFPKDRFLSMGVELLLRKALEDLGEDYEGIVMEKGPFGKPCIRGSDIRFNLSHSERRVMCSVSEQEVGCDTEEVRPIDLDIAKRYFHGTEYEAISEEQDMVRRNLLFYRYWTLKESFMKVTGLGFSIPLDSFEIVLGDGITVEQSVDDVDYRFASYDTGDGYMNAVCSAGDVFEGGMIYVPLWETFGHRRVHRYIQAKRSEGPDRNRPMRPVNPPYRTLAYAIKWLFADSSPSSG
ncbi:MAG: 4'-phosphopantetheinyl transferase superfamily protein [Candidatus Methanomethylophilaceae archaeon]|nr:4'-phosphopantetheinyl transferase superfamily protein [Candidatus Methanomethylophilaceae archaeon]